jgi:riboflavin transporter FmnP
MKTKTIGIIIAFTALTTVLNYIPIPVPFLPNYSYQLGDIAIVTAFLLFGPKYGVSVSFLNMFVSMTILFGPGSFVGPPYYFISVLAMLTGVYASEKLVIWRRFPLKTHSTAKPALFATILSVLSRTLIMLPLDYFLYGFLVSIVSGFSISQSYAIVIAVMPLIILFNITVPLYVIPTSYFIREKVAKGLKIEPNNKIRNSPNSQITQTFFKHLTQKVLLLKKLR